MFKLGFPPQIIPSRGTLCHLIIPPVLSESSLPDLTIRIMTFVVEEVQAPMKNMFGRDCGGLNRRSEALRGMDTLGWWIVHVCMDQAPVHPNYLWAHVFSVRRKIPRCNETLL
jgi:hypothetical protein